MMEQDKKDGAAEFGRCDSPATPRTQQQQQTRTPTKSPTQYSRPQSTQVHRSPLPSKKHMASNKSSSRPVNTIKGTGSRPSSPVKQSGSRPSSRASSPLKWTPVPGKNEHFETTPTGFRYTIELPESKIVPKKNGSATPNKATVAPADRKQSNAPRCADSPLNPRSKSAHKEMLERVTISEKKGPGAGVSGDAEPSPKATPLRSSNHRTRASVKLTKINGTHAGTPTVELTKGVTWTEAKLRSPSTLGNTSIDTEAKPKKIEAEEDRLHANGVLATPGKSDPEQKVKNGNKAEVDSMRRSVPSSMPTNFGEMLRNSSQGVLHMSTDLNDKPETEKMFSSPTVLDKVKRKSDIKTVSFLGIVTKSQLSGNTTSNEHVSQVSNDKAHNLSKSKLARATEPPRTPTGTPPALIVAMEAEMDDIRTSLRRSLGEGYNSVPPSPVSTHWPGSSINDNASPTQAIVRTKTAAIKRTTRSSLNRDKGTTNKNSQLKAIQSDHARKVAPLALRNKGKLMGEAESPFRTRLPRLSPTKSKSKPQSRTAGMVMQTSYDSSLSPQQSLLSLPSGVPAMASRRTQYARASQEEAETVSFASAEEIAEQVRKWNTKSLGDKRADSPSNKLPAKPVAKSPFKAVGTPRTKLNFMSPTATSVNKQAIRIEKKGESFTPPGSPGNPVFRPHSPPKSQLAGPTPSSSKKVLLPLKNPKIRALATPRTPLPRSKSNRRIGTIDQGALRTPSKEIENNLDKEINDHLESQEREGRIFTPGGQRIQDLLAARRRSESEGN